jgi:hypothetical protein
MKAIRYITVILIFAASVGHILLFIQEPRAEGSAVVLFFGIVYLVIGTFLIQGKKYSPVFGILFPLIGLVYGLIAFDPVSAPLILNILGIIDIMMIILCSILVWGTIKKTQ